jgi:hypothetical protein
MLKVKARNFVFSLLVAALLALAASTAVFAGNSDPVYVEFYKTDPEEDFVWNGTVSGGVNGELETALLDATQSGPILHVVFDWIITGSDCDFTARMNGTLDTQSGKVLMNGTVTDGCYLGAQVHEEGQLVDPTVSGFAGTIRVMPGSAD